MVSADLENQGYDVGAAILPACSLDASHMRARAVILAYSESHRQHGGSGTTADAALSDLCAPNSVADAASRQREWWAQFQTRWDALYGAQRVWPNIGGGSDVEHAAGEQWGEREYAPIARATQWPDRRYLAEPDGGISEPQLGGTIAGAAGRLDRYPNPALQGEDPYPWEAPRTIAARQPNHARRLKAIGNGVYVPLWYEIFRTIAVVDAEIVHA